MISLSGSILRFLHVFAFSIVLLGCGASGSKPSASNEFLTRTQESYSRTLTTSPTITSTIQTPLVVTSTPFQQTLTSSIATHTPTQSSQPIMASLIPQKSTVTSVLISDKLPIEVIDMQIDPVRPIDLTAQISYLPPQAGGSFRQEECRNMDDGSGRKSINTTKEKIYIGDLLTICYINFTGASIEEMIFDPNETLIRHHFFTAEEYHPFAFVPVPPLDLDATDYMSLVGDTAGIYTIIVRSDQQEYRRTFEVRPEIISKNNKPSIVPRGRGPSELSPSLLKDAFLFVSGFEMNEKIDIIFWRPCIPVTADSYVWADFVASSSTYVDSNGQAFLRVPQDLGNTLASADQYIVGVRGEITPRTIGGPGWINDITLSAYSGNGFGSIYKPKSPCEAALEIDSSERSETQPTSSLTASTNDKIYRTRLSNDGFIVVREEPTTKSREIQRLASYTQVTCTDIVQGEQISGDARWIYCPSVQGYIFYQLLEPITP